MSSRVPLITGNWKMHKTLAATRTLLAELRKSVDDLPEVEVTVAPPFTALTAAAESLAGSSIGFGAQNMHHAEEGAYTGEISPVMLTDLGARFVILGHSERRALFGETDQSVSRKLRAALAHGLAPYVCCGESQQQRESGETRRVVSGQLRTALEGLDGDRADQLVVAYEPVWAIGTGLTATPEQAQSVHAAIRELLRELLGATVSEAVRILYGGSVKPENAAELLAQPDIDGALVGGASLDAASFAGIARAVC
ncbi:MAG TPA: triose-phosphate isomerase [Acidobacteriota bacterium]|nr:triose-phosphate isomerase [Acidobacteriota bacterium]